MIILSIIYLLLRVLSSVAGISFYCKLLLLCRFRYEDNHTHGNYPNRVGRLAVIQKSVVGLLCEVKSHDLSHDVDGQLFYITLKS